MATAARVARGGESGSTVKMRPTLLTLTILACTLNLAAQTAPTQNAPASQVEASKPPENGDALLRKSVVKISVTQETRSPLTPWKRESPEKFGGSGVVIAPGRVLTNAHVVEQVSEILVESPQTALPISFELVAIDPSRDLALLSTTDAEFIKNHPPIPLFDGLPKEGTRVTVMGYPMGGEALSTTSGVISRIEWAEIGRGEEDGMRVQVDAAINFGNSGGPAFVDGKVAGLAFSGMDNAVSDNISYLLATEEVKRFLDEVAAGTIDGNTVANLSTQTLENPALRAKLGVASDVTGVVVIGQKSGPLQAWDIITKVNGQAVDNKGQITIEEDRKVVMDCAIGRFVPSDAAKDHTIDILRDGKPMTVAIPAYSRIHRVIGSYPDGNYPYLMYGPLVFSPLHDELLRNTGAWMVFAESPVGAYFSDDRPSNGKQFIAVTSPLLSSPIGRGYEVMPGQTLKSVNGKTFANFREFVQGLRDLTDEFVVFEFNESNVERIVLKRSEIEAATEKLMDSNGIRRQCSKDVRDVWEKE